MALRVAIAGVHTETNTFSPIQSDLVSRDTIGIARDAQIAAQYASSQHTIAGFLRACHAEAAEVVPLVYANAFACGPLSAATFDALVGEIVDGLRENGPFDVVLLAGHGAAVSDNCLDPEAELAARVRATVGPDTTVAMALDLHGNISQRLVAALDVAVGYRENPHGDPVVRGEECATLAIRAAHNEIRPVLRLVQLPMVVPILGGWTAAGAMRDAMDEAARIASRTDLLSYTVFHGFGYADVPQMGSSVLAVGDGDESVVDSAADALAHSLWRHREGLVGRALTPPEAFEHAAERGDRDGAVVMLDDGDNVGGGAPGDSTILLSEAVARGVRGFVVTLCDPLAVKQATAAGMGAELQLPIGLTTAVSVGPRLTLSGRVTRTCDGRFNATKGSHGGNPFYDGGPTVRFTTALRQEVVLTSRPLPAFSPELMRVVGLQPERQPIVVAKGVTAPRAGYAELASEFVLVDTPGVTSAELSRFSYENRRRPMWPFEPDTTFDRRSPAPAREESPDAG